ncbi:unnamed protein product [Ilex paraguariensis]|uniref:Disease resistance protein n=1 Tax=Ilex paraguariensis TaxID=185542 RepID=A0ABC8U1N6_9AQUA
MMPCLGKMIIKSCPKLTKVPCLASVHHLELENCNEMLLGSAANFPSLTSLVIHLFPELTYLPEGMLINKSVLTSLVISSCPKLLYLPDEFIHLVSLKSLVFRRCNSLSSCPPELQSLSSLTSLEICDVQKCLLCKKKSEV